MNLVVQRTNINGTNTVPATASAATSGADPAAALNGAAGAEGGISGLLQMLMGFLQQFLGMVSEGLGNFFNQDVSKKQEAGAAPANGQTSSPAPSPRNDFANKAGVSSIPPDGKFNSSHALDLASSDDARNGHCGRGVHNILTAQGYRVPSADGHDWDRTLPQSGWVKLEGIKARDAPEGSVLVYNSDVQSGRKPRNGRDAQGGDEFGHVEVVCYDAQGNRKYVSDAARSNFGGTVPDNFVGAYVPRERYELMLAAQRRNLQETTVAKNDSAIITGRNGSVATAIDGEGIQTTASLKTSLTDQHRLVAIGPAPAALPAPQQTVAPGSGLPVPNAPTFS